MEKYVVMFSLGHPPSIVFEADSPEELSCYIKEFERRYPIEVRFEKLLEEAPKSCYTCQCCDWHHKICNLTGVNLHPKFRINTRLKDCPMCT